MAFDCCETFFLLPTRLCYIYKYKYINCRLVSFSLSLSVYIFFFWIKKFAGFPMRAVVRSSPIEPYGFKFVSSFC